jgi:hypothetical protein
MSRFWLDDMLSVSIICTLLSTYSPDLIHHQHPVSRSKAVLKFRARKRTVAFTVSPRQDKKPWSPNTEKHMPVWFKIQIPNFIDGNPLAGQSSSGFRFKIQIPKFERSDFSDLPLNLFRFYCFQNFDFFNSSLPDFPIFTNGFINLSTTLLSFSSSTSFTTKKRERLRRSA